MLIESLAAKNHPDVFTNDKGDRMYTNLCSSCGRPLPPPAQTGPACPYCGASLLQPIAPDAFPAFQYDLTEFREYMAPEIPRVGQNVPVALPPPSFPFPPVAQPVAAFPQAPQIPRTHRRGFVAFLLLGLAALLVAGGSLIYFTRFHQAAVLQTQFMNSTQTAIAQATIDNLSPQALYERVTRGKPVLSDPLSSANLSSWQEYTNANEICLFTRGAYHIENSRTNTFAFCPLQNRVFQNLAFQVQMNIVQGDAGGLMFRASLDLGKFYRFRIERTGTYVLIMQTDYSASHDRYLLEGQSSQFHVGLGQNNLLAVIALGHDIYLYINSQFIGHVSDPTYTTGTIALTASDLSDSTDVAYQNAQVWTI